MDQKILFEIKKFCGAPVFFTDRKKVKNFEQVIKTLPKNSIIIIREYDLDEESREIFAKNIISLARPRGLKILAAKSFSLARKIKADGVHFSDRDILPLQFFKKKSFPKNFIFSFAAHDFRVLNKIKADMIFLSPIFATSSHPDTKPLGLRNLAKISLKTRKAHYFSPPVYALGGVNAQNLKSLRKLGIHGFAAIDLFSKDL